MSYQKLDCGCELKQEGTSIHDIKLKGLCKKHQLQVLQKMDKISIVTNECFIMNQKMFPEEGIFSEIYQWANAKWQQGWDSANKKDHRPKFVKITFELIDDPYFSQTKKENGS